MPLEAMPRYWDPLPPAEQAQHQAQQREEPPAPPQEDAGESAYETSSSSAEETFMDFARRLWTTEKECRKLSTRHLHYTSLFCQKHGDGCCETHECTHIYVYMCMYKQSSLSTCCRLSEGVPHFLTAEDVLQNPQNFPVTVAIRTVTPSWLWASILLVMTDDDE